MREGSKRALNKALLELSPKKMHIDKLREILNVEELEEDISEEVYVREKKENGIGRHYRRLNWCSVCWVPCYSYINIRNSVEMYFYPPLMSLSWLIIFRNFV
ncbi:MAG: hypothetical protein R6U44_07315 [Archaeoglobaceae archaeon]